MDILIKIAAIVYSLCFKKQTLGPLLHLFFKAELPTNGSQDILFLGSRAIQTSKKLLRGHWVIPTYLALKFPQLQPRKDNFFISV